MKDVIEFVNSSPILVEAHIADLHFGVIEPAKQFSILKEQFLDYLDKMQSLDIVSINGDIFEHKFMANSDATVYALYFINELVAICKKKNSSLILISGTPGHDADQLKLFTPYLRDESLDLRIVFEAQFIYIKGKKILIIPELYNRGEEYYDKLLLYSGAYDACYMHGTLVGAIAGKNDRDLGSDREPVFDIDDFRLCRGPIISGHVHVHNRYKKHFYYCGSPLRWRFGEEEDKGFLILIHDTNKSQYYIHFEPIRSFYYNTVYLDDLLDKDPMYIIQAVQRLKDQGIDFIRVRFTRNIVDKITIIKEYYRIRPDIKIETDFSQEKLNKQLEQMDEQLHQYDYFFDKSISPMERFVKYINKQEGQIVWTVDSLEEFLREIEKL